MMMKKKLKKLSYYFFIKKYIMQNLLKKILMTNFDQLSRLFAFIWSLDINILIIIINITQKNNKKIAFCFYIKKYILQKSLKNISYWLILVKKSCLFTLFAILIIIILIVIIIIIRIIIQKIKKKTNK